jgi:hypothetical protein
MGFSETPGDVKLASSWGINRISHMGFYSRQLDNNPAVWSRIYDIYVCTEEHNHKNDKHHLLEKTKILIKQCVLDSVKNSIIQRKIREQMLPQITATQLNNYKATLNTKAKTKSGHNELIDWCENHSLIPEDDDTVFEYELGNFIYNN